MQKEDIVTAAGPLRSQIDVLQREVSSRCGLHTESMGWQLQGKPGRMQ